MPPRSQLGNLGESDAIVFLQSKKLLILEQNYYVRGGEIDIICRDGQTLVFVEVKSRRQSSFGTPLEAINFVKLMKMRRAINVYLINNGQNCSKFRIDVIGIVYSDDLKQKKISHYQNISFDDVK